jgi:hypothetical protein
MTVQVAVGVFVVVHALSVYLLRASGVWKVLFTHVRNLAPDVTPDPLRVAPRGWIENHAFWDLDEDDERADEDDAEVIFWGSRQRRAG